MFRKLIICSTLCLAANAFAAGKVFNKDYTGVSQILAEITTHEGKIVVDLNFKAAPNTVANFVELANQGFYNGLVFHRVIDDEKNDLKHETGVISMANKGPNTGGSQFFITHLPQPHLDGHHTVFGKVIEGHDVVCRIDLNDPILNIKIVEKK